MYHVGVTSLTMPPLNLLTLEHRLLPDVVTEVGCKESVGLCSCAIRAPGVPPRRLQWHVGRQYFMNVHQ